MSILGADMIQIVLLVFIASAQGQSPDIFFPGKTNANTNSIHNLAAEINRNNVQSFIGEAGRVDFPVQTNPFPLFAGQGATAVNGGAVGGGGVGGGGAFAPSGPTIGTFYPNDVRPQSNIRPLVVQSAVASPQLPTVNQQGILLNNQASGQVYRPTNAQPTTNVQQYRPVQDSVTIQQAHEISFQSGHQVPVTSQVASAPTNSISNSGQGFPQTVQGPFATPPPQPTFQQSPTQNTFGQNPQSSVQRNERINPYVSFAYQLLVNAKTGTQNLVLSPLLTQATLALLQYGAVGLTRQEIGEIVQSPLSDITRLLSSLTAISSQTTIIEYAATVFTNNESRLNRTFAALASEAKSSVVPVNFRTPAQTVQQINSWVSQATRRAIPWILDQNADTRDLQMLLVNAIYFKSKWKYEFQKSERGEFYKAKAANKAVTFIKTKQYLPTGSIETHGRSGGAFWVEIPYAGEDFSMVILVPRFRDTLLSLLSELSASHVETIINQLGSPSRHLVDLKIPKFDIETKTSLLGPLRDMGLGRLFVAPSELVYINERQRASVDDCVHNARLTVDETGTIAAAANAFSIIPLSISAPDPEVKFIVDQPFLAMIVDTRYKYPLFMAKVFDP